MFTGIISSIGVVKSIIKKQETIALSIDMNNLNTDNLLIGDSIAVNGVCLTVTNLMRNTFIADVMPETYQSTNLKYLTTNSPVNLERALALNQRLNGHFVSGHVDAVIKITKKYQQQNAIYFEFNIPIEFNRQIITKGSVALDGTSLTVCKMTNNRFQIALIPHSLEHTILGAKQISDPVNLETDLLAKYIQKTMHNIDK